MNKFQKFIERAKKINLAEKPVENFLDTLEVATEDGDITYPERDQVIEVMRKRSQGQKV